MSFSADDLKQLKERIAENSSRIIKFSPTISLESFKALLFRLEAAEKCARFLDARTPDAGSMAPVELEALETWHKACE
jgi:hypothetical protein